MLYVCCLKLIFDILKLRLFFIGDVNGIYCLKDFNLENYIFGDNDVLILNLFLICYFS